jgi:hypothetical protein
MANLAAIAAFGTKGHDQLIVGSLGNPPERHRRHVL